ncbi:MAG: FAD-binding oxidoreductase [Verrucomicrobiae bacterium]|nr:FAD-binding oxidoreductase [Verrucomicrobiae bacterium]
MLRSWVRPILIVGTLILALALARPAAHLMRVAWKDRNDIEKVPAGFVDDVSRMNQAKVSAVWEAPGDERSAEESLRRLLETARKNGLQVSIAGARHSMGGQTIFPGGIAVDMSGLRAMRLDPGKTILHVQAGARWADVIPYLDAQGRSIGVMQSDNNFSVGGSLSVNCHGWQYDRPPISSTVESFRLMKADGTVVGCSRTENSELFSLALGGYGLFGIILDADLRVVPNQRLRLEQQLVPLDDALKSFDRQVREKPGVSMVYARLDITPQNLFRQVIINLFYPEARGEIPSLAEPEFLKFRRAMFRGSVDSDYGKDLRWRAETKLQPRLAGKIFSRNQLLNESADWFLDHSSQTTDILHEYFIPRAGAMDFLADLKRIIPARRADLLNVTVRQINEDKDTFLRYADRPVIAFVMFFNMKRTPEADTKMESMTGEIIEAAIQRGGRYYLPYRLHATRDQFHRAYPQASRFFELKRKYDPNELFQNQFYVKYGRR